MRLVCRAISVVICSGMLLGAQEDRRRDSPPTAQRKASPKSRTVKTSDIDRLTTYATVLGRAIGCGLNVDLEMKRVGRWMDQKFPPGSERQKTYLPIFLDGIKYHAQQQKSGKSPDSCEAIRHEVRTFPWP